MSDSHPPRILLIDPDPESAASLFPLLAAEGYRTVSCSSMLRSLSAVQREHPDLVIVSKHVENCDGMILIGRIKERFRDMRVILLIEPEDWPSLLDATDAGADDLQKRQAGAQGLLESVRRLLDPVTSRALRSN